MPPTIYRPAGNVYSPRPEQYRAYVPPRPQAPPNYQQQVQQGNQMLQQRQQQQIAQAQAYRDSLPALRERMLAEQQAMTQQMAMPQTPQTPGAPGTPPAPAPMPPPQLNLNTGFTPISLPTRESQNQLHALGIQRGLDINNLQRAVGSSGIRAGSGVIAQQMMNPMLEAMQAGSLGAANLGIDDQITRDTHALKGIRELTMADIENLRNQVQRDAIGIDARNRTFGSMVDMLRSLGGIFNSSGLLGGF